MVGVQGEPMKRGRHLALSLVNVCCRPVADDDLRPVEQFEVVHQECKGQDDERGSQHGWPWGLFDAKEGNHDDLEEEHRCDDVLEDLHP